MLSQFSDTVYSGDYGRFDPSNGSYDPGGGFSWSFAPSDLSGGNVDSDIQVYSANAGTGGINLDLSSLVNLFKQGAGNAEAKKNATAIVNYAEGFLSQNLDKFMATQRSQSDVQTGLANFDQVWNWVVTQLSKLGTIGQKSIQERSRTGRPPWGRNWFELYRDPISGENYGEPQSGTTPSGTINQGSTSTATPSNSLTNFLTQERPNSILWIAIAAAVGLVIWKVAK